MTLFLPIASRGSLRTFKGFQGLYSDGQPRQSGMVSIASLGVRGFGTTRIRTPHRVYRSCSSRQFHAIELLGIVCVKVAKLLPVPLSVDTSDSFARTIAFRAIAWVDLPLLFASLARQGTEMHTSPETISHSRWKTVSIFNSGGCSQKAPESSAFAVA